MSKQEFKVGDLVRIVVGGGTVYCAHDVGAIGEVVKVPNELGFTDVLIGTLVQGLEDCQIKLAKQAMKKREAYEARRG